MVEKDHSAVGWRGAGEWGGGEKGTGRGGGGGEREGTKHTIMLTEHNAKIGASIPPSPHPNVWFIAFVTSINTKHGSVHVPRCQAGHVLVLKHRATARDT